LPSGTQGGPRFTGFAGPTAKYPECRLTDPLAQSVGPIMHLGFPAPSGRRPGRVETADTQHVPDPAREEGRSRRCRTCPIQPLSQGVSVEKAARLSVSLRVIERLILGHFGRASNCQWWQLDWETPCRLRERDPVVASPHEGLGRVALGKPARCVPGTAVSLPTSSRPTPPTTPSRRRSRQRLAKRCWPRSGELVSQ
jgi:hypothetical protein